MKLHTMKGCLWVNGHIHNVPAFDSRTKEDLIACQGSSGQAFEIINYSKNTYATAAKWTEIIGKLNICWFSFKT
jgi:hypothetical protein